ncbi:MAG TPA: ribonuclease HII [Candidatus Paceibacterota bacterium]|nr:ribonuclease HII [Candidatus Paceibacterota bacterium]
MNMVLGVDEAGRGPLAGPVAVGVIAAPADFDFLTVFPGLNDSKKLSEKRREALYLLLQEEIRKGTVRAKVCYASEKTIDRKGIAFAVRSALARGVRALAPESHNVRVYLDGSLAAPKEYMQETVIGGDATIPAIMLASIAAKVSRDRLMLRLAKEYPQYGFEQHKGYGTKAHYAALEAHGPCAIHRRSFL